MHKALGTFLFLFSCIVLRAQTSVSFPLSDMQYGISQAVNATITLQPWSVGYNGQLQLMPFQISQVTGTNGSTTFTNLFGSPTSGFYHWVVAVSNSSQRVAGNMWIASTNLGTISEPQIDVVPGAVSYPAGTWCYSAIASDSRYNQGTNSFANFATIAFVIATSNSIASLIPSTNGFVTQSITNGLATTNWVNGLFAGLGSIVSSNANAYATPTQALYISGLMYSNNPSGYLTGVPPATTNWVYPSNNPSGFLSAVPAGATNLFVQTNVALSYANNAPLGGAFNGVVTNGGFSQAGSNTISSIAAAFAGSATNAINNNNGVGTNTTIVTKLTATNIVALAITPQSGNIYINPSGGSGDNSIIDSFQIASSSALGGSAISSFESTLAFGQSYNSLIASENSYIGNLLSGFSGGGNDVVLGGLHATNFGSASVVAGSFVVNSNANVFIWSDGTTPAFWYSQTNSQFLVHANNGMGVNTNWNGTNTINVLGNINANSITVNGAEVATTAAAATLVNGTNTLVTNNGTVYGINVYGLDTNGAGVYNFGAASNYVGKVSLAISNAPQFALSVTNQSTGNTLSNLQLNGSPQVNGTLTVGSGSVLDMNDGNIEDQQSSLGGQAQVLTAIGGENGVLWQNVTNLNCATTSAPVLFNPTFWGNITIGGLYQRTTNGVLSVNGYTGSDINGNQTYIRVSSTLWIGTNFLTAPTWTILTNGLTCLAQSNGITLATSSTLNGLYTPTIGVGSPVVTNGSAINENGVMHLGTLLSQFLEGNGGMLWGLTNAASFGTNQAVAGSLFRSKDGTNTEWTQGLTYQKNASGAPILGDTNATAGLNFAGTSTLGTLIVTNLNQQVFTGNGSGLTNLNVGIPFNSIAYIHTNGTVTFNGVNYNYSGSSDYGIMETWNLMPKSSSYSTVAQQEFDFDGGDFYCSTPLAFTNGFPDDIKLRGSDIKSTRLYWNSTNGVVYKESVDGSLINTFMSFYGTNTVQGSNTTAKPQEITIENMDIVGVTDCPAALVYCGKYFSTVLIDNCTFSDLACATNLLVGNMLSINLGSGANNPVPGFVCVVLDSGGQEHKCEVMNSFFGPGVADGVEAACDHIYMIDDKGEGVSVVEPSGNIPPQGSLYTNLWPLTSKYSLGACILRNVVSNNVSGNITEDGLDGTIDGFHSWLSKGAYAKIGGRVVHDVIRNLSIEWGNEQFSYYANGVFGVACDNGYLPEIDSGCYEWERILDYHDVLQIYDTNGAFTYSTNFVVSYQPVPDWNSIGLDTYTTNANYKIAQNLFVNGTVNAGTVVTAPSFIITNSFVPNLNQIYILSSGAGTYPSGTNTTFTLSYSTVLSNSWVNVFTNFTTNAVVQFQPFNTLIATLALYSPSSEGYVFEPSNQIANNNPMEFIFATPSPLPQSSADLAGIYTGNVIFSNPPIANAGSFIGNGSGITNLPSPTIPTTGYLTNVIYTSTRSGTLQGSFALITSIGTGSTISLNYTNAGTGYHVFNVFEPSGAANTYVFPFCYRFPANTTFQFTTSVGIAYPTNTAYVQDP